MYEEKKKGTLNKKSADDEKGHKNEKQEKSENNIESVVADYVKKALEEAKKSWEKDFEARVATEREDAAKLATMSSEERAKVEMERKQKDFENERQLYVNERAEFEAAKELAAQNLPVSFAKMVANADRDVMAQNIETFKAEYMKAIEMGLSQRLKGTLPRVSKEKEQMGDPFLSGLGM